MYPRGRAPIIRHSRRGVLRHGSNRQCRTVSLELLSHTLARSLSRYYYIIECSTPILGVGRRRRLIGLLPSPQSPVYYHAIRTRYNNNNTPSYIKGELNKRVLEGGGYIFMRIEEQKSVAKSNHFARFFVYGFYITVTAMK